MVSGHEQSHFANSADDQLDRQMERLVDQGVATPYGAAAQVLEFDPHRDSVVVRDPRAAKAAKNQPHHSRRGGRSYNEGSDSEHDQYWQVANPSELSEEDKLINRVGAGTMLAALQADRQDPDAEAKHQLHLEEVRRRADEELQRAR